MRGKPGFGLASRLLALLLLARSAAAAAGESPPRVEIHVDGSLAAVIRTRDTAEELFARLGVEVLVVGADDGELGSVPPTPPAAIVHIDLSSELKPRLVIADGRSGREIERREFSETASLETAVEAVTHVCYLVLEPRLHPKPPPAAPVATATRPRPASPPALPAPLPARSPAPQVVFGVGANFAALGLGGGGVLPGGGVSADARIGRSSDRFGALVLGTLYGASTLSSGAAEAGLRPFGLRLFVTRDVSLRGRLALLLGAGGGADRFQLEPGATPADVELTGTRSVWSPVLSALGGLRLALGQRVFLVGLAGLDIDPAPRSFSAVAGDRRTVLLSLSRFRPALLIGASLALNDAPSSGTRTAAP